MRPAIKVKEGIVEEIVESFKNAVSIVFVDYRGITVAEDTKLRRAFRNENVTYKVYKNRLIARALNELGITDYDAKLLEGTTSVIIAHDETTGAKLFANAMKEYNKMDFKFGILNGKVIAKEEVVALSKLPTKPVLISMLLGMLQAPVASLARALNEIAKKQAE